MKPVPARGPYLGLWSEKGLREWGEALKRWGPDRTRQNSDKITTQTLGIGGDGKFLRVSKFLLSLKL
jgi:hypothetical protein